MFIHPSYWTFSDPLQKPLHISVKENVPQQRV